MQLRSVPKSDDDLVHHLREAVSRYPSINAVLQVFHSFPGLETVNRSTLHRWCTRPLVRRLAVARAIEVLNGDKQMQRVDQTRSELHVRQLEEILALATSLRREAKTALARCRMEQGSRKKTS